MARVLSGVQPSGAMHLGNFLGAFRQWVTAQLRRDRADAQPGGETFTFRYAGRDFRLTDVHGNVVKGLLA